MVNKMKLLRIIPITLALCTLSIFPSACASKSATAPQGQVVTVELGNLSTAITGVGNLALSKKVDLAFDIPSSFSTASNPLSVEQVLVQEAESVKEGQVLAKLDTAAWEDQLTALEDKVTTANTTLTQKQRAVTSAERAVATAERNVTLAERGVTTAERAVTSAKYNVIQAQINLNNAQTSLEQTEETSTDPLEIEAKQLALEMARGKLADAQQAVDDAQTTGIGDAQQAVDDAKVKLEDAQTAVEDAQTAITIAQKALEDAQTALADAKSASAEVKSPFDGFITNVNVTGGQEVKKGTVAVTIADPTKFEAQIMVSEIDILNVSLEEAASVQVQAMPGVSFPATVTHIAPTATIQSGVVNYQVTVELTSLQPITTQRQTRTAATGNVTTGAPSGRSGQGFSSGNLTQSQINQMIQQRQQARAGAGQSGGQSTQAPAAPTGNAQLSEGMTITVTITTAQRNNVLLVPTQAIISQGGGTFVQVLNNGVTEQRAVQTGISNWQYVEITSGLNEGEQVIVPQVTTTTTTTSTQQQRPPQPSGIQGMQRMLR